MLCIARRRLFFAFDENRVSNSRRSFHLCSRRKPRTIGAAVDKLRVALDSKPSLETLIAAGKQIIADAISKVRFWPQAIQSVIIPDDSHRLQRANVGQLNTTNTTTAQLFTPALHSPS